MTCNKRILSLLLALVMLVTATLPVFAQEAEPPANLILVSDDDTEQPDVELDLRDAETDLPDDETDLTGNETSPVNSGTPTQLPDPIPDELNGETAGEAAQEQEPPSLGYSSPDVSDKGAFLLNCTPEQAAELIAFYEYVHEQIATQPLFRPAAASGDSGTVSWSWGESVGIDVPSGDPNNPYHIGNIPRITLSTANPPIGRPFCVEFGVDPGGSYTASEGSDSRVLSLLVAYEKGSASAVGVQLALWYTENGIPLSSHTQAAAALSAANSVDTTGYTYLIWSSGSGQPFVTLDKAEDDEPEEPEEPGDEDEEPENPNTHTEVTTETSTRTEVRSSTEYTYSDAIGQITVAKRDDEGNSLDGAIFNIEIQFANGERGGDSAFEVYNGSRLFTWTHPADDHQPATVTVTEVYCPPGYVMDPTPQTAIVHPTYTRVTKVLTHTITITTTTTTTSVIDIDSGEVLAESSASSSAETELNPPTVQEYTDFIEGDRETTLTYVNKQLGAELIIFKYTSGTSTPLAGAQFEVSYVDPAIDSSRWIVTTGTDGKAVIQLPKPGAVLIHEVSPPAYHVITSAGPDYTVTLAAGESKQVDIPNDPFTSVEVTKVDSVTGARLAGATISLKHISSGMEYRLVTDSNGIALFENVEPGSYYVEEIVAPDRYVLNTTRYPVELRSHEVATVTIPNDPYTGIEVTKVDANNGQKLAGAYIRLVHISSGQEYSGETGADGSVYFGQIPPGDYWVEETQAPYGYNLNDTRYPLELKTGELATLTIANYRKDGLFIRKVDENGAPIAGAVFELRRGSGAVLLRETTDNNGLIYRGFLTTDTYVAEEIQAPVGYLMDENNPQSIYIDEQDDNKEYVLTFVNKKKPAIEVIKVDGSDPTKKLQGAVFRVSEQGGSKSWDITTSFDGTALLENLEIDTTYIVEELTPPSGYRNSGYREAIVLSECRVHTVTVSNDTLPGLNLRKIDADTGEGLPGAVLRLSLDGTTYWDVTTGEGGYVNLTDLAPGLYTVSERQAPSGYLLDDSPHYIELTAGETAELVIQNSRKPGLKIIKLDAGTKAPLPGATFRVSVKNGRFIGDYLTDENGEIFLEGLEPGLYSVWEVIAPTGYLLDSTQHDIEVLAGGTAELLLQNERQPSLRIVKLDSVTKEPLQYATFRVSVKNGKLIGIYTTDENGEIFLDNLEPDWYLFEEIAAPSGYNILEESREFLLEAGMNVTLEFLNEPQNPLFIYKVDSKTGDPLSGAKFRVTKVSGEFIGEYTTGRNGYITVPGLEPGWFSVVEIKAPDGYVLSNTPVTVELKMDQPAVVELENDPLGDLQIKKVDSGTGLPLEDALFRVTTTEGTLVGEYTTGSDGFIHINGLAPDSYLVSELRAPEGFLLDLSPRTVVVKTGETVLVEFPNDALPGLQVQKRDAVTGDPLEGARFAVSHMNGETVGTYTTNQAGFFVLTDLNPGWFTIFEEKAPTGYITDSTPQNVELKANETAVVYFDNDRLPTLQIRKVDETTGLPLGGALVRVTTSTGELVGEYTTSADGMILIPDLEPGDYIVTEQRAPEGFALDSTPRTVTAKANETAVVEISNKALPGLRVQKVDAETGEPLAGAKFQVSRQNGEAIGAYTTNAAGFFLIPDLDAGWYTVFESAAPAGYLTDRTPQSVELKYNETAVVEFENKPMPGLQIKKVDSETGLPLAGVTFTVEELDGRRLGSFTTDDNGLIYIPDLEEGWLVVTETATVDGYKLDSAPRNVEVLSGRLNLLEVSNMPWPYLTIKKVDSETGEILTGVRFKVFDKDNRELGEFTTNSLGIIALTGMEPGVYYVRESQAIDGYQLDSTVHEVTLYAGKTTTLEIPNTPLSTFRLKKVDAVTGEALPGAVFLLYDAKDNIIGEYTSDERGYIEFPQSLAAGAYKAKETAAPEGYVLSDQPVSFELKPGETTEIRFENEPERGNIQIVKKSADVNTVTGDKAGALLEGAVFEIVDEDMEVVDTITTDARGVAKSIDLPIGKFAIQEVSAPDHYLLDDGVFYAEIKKHGDVVRFEVLNDSADLEVTIEKTGNVEALAGDVIRYDFTNIANNSNVALEDFYWHDTLPEELRLESLFTGTYSQKLTYRVTYRTNLKSDYRVWEDGLSTTHNNELAVADLKLAAGEYVTDFRVELGKVEAGFHEEEAPMILTRVLEDLPNEQRFVNRADAGGTSGGEAVTAKDSWVTIVYALPKGPLPRTGFDPAE